MGNELQRQCADVTMRQEECLRSLASGRKVFLYTPELGVLCRIMEESSTTPNSAIAPFFKPWLFGQGVTYVQGDIGIEVPIMDLLLNGMVDKILESLKSAPCSRLAGVSYPNGALWCLLKSQMADAKSYLDAITYWQPRQPRPPRKWLETACYWSGLPGSEQKIRNALNHADPCDPDTAIGWYRLCGDHDRAEKLVETSWLQLPAADWISRAHYLKWADFFGRVSGHEPSSRACLELSEQQGASDGAVSLFHCAMAWAGLIGEKNQAVLLADKAMRATEEFGAIGALWWQSFMNDTNKARECLTRPGMWADTVGATLTRIEQMMIYGVDPQEAEKLLQHIQWDSVDPDFIHKELCRAARLWRFLFGNIEKCKEILSHALNTAKKTCDLLPIAETYLDLSYLSPWAQTLACREILKLAESKQDTPLDFIFCAQEWLRLAGDDDRAAECLKKAEEQISYTEEDDLPFFGNVRIDLFDRSKAGKSRPLYRN